MDQKLSVPAAIIVAGLVIAGAILITRAPARTLSFPAGSPAAVGTAASPSPTAVEVNIRPVDVTRDHIRGDANAPITLVEFSDTECPFCKRFHETVQQAVTEYSGKVRWVYRHFPLESLHAKARKEALATECAAAQGKFWEYLDRLFTVTPSNDGLDPKRLPVIAREVGVDVAAFEQCLEREAFAQRVTEDLDDATSAGGQGTPFTVILGPKGEKIPFTGAQPYTNLKQVIDQLLSRS